MTKSAFSTHPWDDIDARPLICGLCALDATDMTRDLVPPCMTRVVNTVSARYDIYVGRGKGSPWASPFTIGKDGTRTEVVAKYTTWFLGQPALLAKLHELRGQTLGCWCLPERPCHAEVLADFADRQDDQGHIWDGDTCLACGLDATDMLAVMDYILPCLGVYGMAAVPVTTDRDLKPSNLDQYRRLEIDLRATRRNHGAGATTEDPVIDAMTRLWSSLTDVERAVVDDEGSTCFPDRDLKPDNVILELPVRLTTNYDVSTIILDCESTGTDTAKDQILELAFQFGFEGTDDAGNPTPAPQMTWRFKPDVPIHPGAEKVHGITAESVANCPTFKVHAQRLFEMIDAAEVLIGYNLKFDLNILAAEFQRVGMPMPELKDKVIVDALRLWHQFEPRTLKAAHQRFVGSDFEGAHGAGADIAATARVTLAMCEAFGLLSQGLSWAEIADIAEPTRKSWLGPSDHFVWLDGAVQVTFGKFKGALLHEIAAPKGGGVGYLKWIQSHDFPSHVKAICREAAQRSGGSSFLDWAMRTYPLPTPDQPTANG